MCKNLSLINEIAAINFQIKKKRHNKNLVSKNKFGDMSKNKLGDMSKNNVMKSIKLVLTSCFI